LAGLGDVHERFDMGDGPPAIEPNQLLAAYLYLIGSKVT
jgi:hypothetical protein